MKRISILLLFVCWQPLCADEAPVYESMRGVRIGPVFLTPEQRRWLDSKRLDSNDGQSGETMQAVAASDAKRKTQPAGYIINSRGERRQWQGNDFKAANAAAVSSTEFPNDVTITRHENTDDSLRDDAGGGDETAD